MALQPGTMERKARFCMTPIFDATPSAALCPEAKRRKLSAGAVGQCPARGWGAAPASLCDSTGHCGPIAALPRVCQPQLQPPQLHATGCLQFSRTVTTSSALTSSSSSSRSTRHLDPQGSHYNNCAYDGVAVVSGQTQWQGIPTAPNAALAIGGIGAGCSSSGCNGRSGTCGRVLTGSWQPQQQPQQQLQQQWWRRRQSSSDEWRSLRIHPAGGAASAADGYHLPEPPSPYYPTCDSNSTTTTITTTVQAPSRTPSPAAAAAAPSVRSNTPHSNHHHHHHHHYKVQQQLQQQQPYHFHQHQHQQQAHPPSQRLELRRLRQHPGPQARGSTARPDAAAASIKPAELELEPSSHATITTPSVSSSAHRGAVQPIRPSCLPLAGVAVAEMEVPSSSFRDHCARGSALAMWPLGGGLRGSPTAWPEWAAAEDEGAEDFTQQAAPMPFYDPAAAFSAGGDGIPAIQGRPPLAAYAAGEPTGQPSPLEPHQLHHILQIHEQQLQQQLLHLHIQQHRTKAGKRSSEYGEYGGGYSEYDELIPPNTPPVQCETAHRMSRYDFCSGSCSGSGEGALLPAEAASAGAAVLQQRHPTGDDSAVSAGAGTGAAASCGMGAAPEIGSPRGPQFVVHLLLHLFPGGIQRPLMQSGDPGTDAGAGGASAETDTDCRSAGLDGGSAPAAAEPVAGVPTCQRQAQAPPQQTLARAERVSVEGRPRQACVPQASAGSTGGGSGLEGRPADGPHLSCAEAAAPSAAAAGARARPEEEEEVAAPAAAPAAPAAARTREAAEAGSHYHTGVRSTSRRSPEPGIVALSSLERRLEAAVAAASAAATAAAAPAVPYPLNVLRARPPASELPRVGVEPFFQPDGSLLKGSVLQTACRVIRLAQLRNHLAMMPPSLGRTSPGDEGELLPGGPSGGAGAVLLPASPAAMKEGRRGVPVIAVLRLLTEFVSAARALEHAEGGLATHSCGETPTQQANARVGASVSGAGDCGGGLEVLSAEHRAAAMRPVAAAVETQTWRALRALRSLMLRGREGALLLLEAAERVLV